jgi:hypothetical protein
MRYMKPNGGVAFDATIWPRNPGGRLAPPVEVPDAYRDLFLEAASVIEASPKASAALSRRCLQHLIREQFKMKKHNLEQEIQAVLDANLLPGDLATHLDAVRNIGNFAAHPMKSTNAGEILEVEPHEADWTLDVLEELFDHAFVRPARLAERKAKFDLKLAEAGKPPLKP